MVVYHEFTLTKDVFFNIEKFTEIFSISLLSKVKIFVYRSFHRKYHNKIHNVKKFSDKVTKHPNEETITLIFNTL